MGMEYEWKFRADPQVQEQLLNDMQCRWERIAMETTYYDTENDDLSRRHYTLRCRKENHKSVCTLKVPAPDGGRGEWELEEESIEAAIPELCKLSDLEELLVLTADGVTAVCGARFDRMAATIDTGETVVEVALDLGILIGGGREIPLCEIEVELKSGTVAAAEAFAARLAVIYGLRREVKSKFRRAIELAKERETWER